MRNTYKILILKPDGMTLRWRFIFIWDDNIKMNLKGTGCGYKGCVRAIQGMKERRVLVNQRLRTSEL
jgi:hypothetical protein